MPLTIRQLTIDPPLALAPMVGLSHSALRTLIVQLGGVGLLFSEMLSAKRLPSENQSISPGLIRGPLESPLFYQIYASETSGGFVSGPEIPVGLYRLEGTGFNDRFVTVTGSKGGFWYSKHFMQLNPCPTCFHRYLPSIVGVP